MGNDSLPGEVDAQPFVQGNEKAVSVGVSRQGWLFPFIRRLAMLKHMKSYTHLKPGQKGTKGLHEKYGDSLLCVRYRYDEQRGLRLKTVEIIVDARPGSPFLRFRDEEIVSVMVPYPAKSLREKLKTAGGKWDPEEKVWRVMYGAIRSDADLVERIVAE